MIPHDSARRPSVLHIFKVYYPDLFGGTPSVIRCRLMLLAGWVRSAIDQVSVLALLS